jgi:biopolymer transport protein ExbB
MQEFNLAEMWSSMGWPVKLINIGMIIMSVWTLYVIIERLITFSKGTRQSYSFVRALDGYLKSHNVDEALSAARRHVASSVAKVVESGLQAYKKGREALEHPGPADVGEFDLVDSVNRSLERVKERETSDLRKGLGALGTIATIAPFVGLLGTVIGIINSFRLLSGGGGGGMDIVGPGIAEALVSTAVGLIVAILAAMGFNYFTGRVESMVVDMNDVSSEFIDFVLREGRA